MRLWSRRFQVSLVSLMAAIAVLAVVFNHFRPMTASEAVKAVFERDNARDGAPYDASRHTYQAFRSSKSGVWYVFEETREPGAVLTNCFEVHPDRRLVQTLNTVSSNENGDMLLRHREWHLKSLKERGLY